MIVHTILYVADQSKSTEYYSHVLAMAPTLNVPGMTEFKLSDKHILGLMPEKGIKRLLGERLPDPAQANGLPRAEVYFRVDEPEIFIRRALERGMKELSAVQPRDWGDRAGYVLDPDGHVLAFAVSAQPKSDGDTINDRPLPNIRTERLILRLPSVSDIPEIIRYFKENESHLAPLEPKRPDGFYTEEFWRSRIPRHADTFQADQAVRLYLFEAENNRTVVGSLEFSQISRGPFQACYLGYGIAKKYEGKGFMFEATQAAIKYAFHDLNLHRIMANHLPENRRSARLLSRLGFRQECVAKEYLRINGEWRDHVLNSLHNPDWRPC